MATRPSWWLANTLLPMYTVRIPVAVTRSSSSWSGTEAPEEAKCMYGRACTGLILQLATTKLVSAVFDLTT